MLGRYTILGVLLFACGLDLTEAEDAVLHRVRRLINGEPVPDGEPWMAVLAYKNGPDEPRPFLIVCGLVVIDNQHILGTAHCVDENVPDIGDDRDTIYVVLGLTDNSWGKVDDVQIFALDGKEASAVLNPDYTVTDVFNNDLSIITLNTPCAFNDHVAALALPPPDIPDSKLKNCHFFGWGLIKDPPHGVTDNLFTRFLRTASLKITKTSKCGTFFLGFLTEDHICADGKAFPCFGDSGSPLVCEYDDKTYLFGLNSFRQRGDCDLKGVPQVYTRVATFLDWISSETH
ncbi:chymotrypsinogen 2-like isoform X2 [Liolophura sinensis]|uniref:chymotrypsinogen 2-like isoform X2 n=1 Tax=Liolophura sinensis TaxID=3198878 RepID=UPI003158D935